MDIDHHAAGRRARVKGRAFEQAKARELRESCPGLEVRRGAQSDGSMIPDITAPPLTLAIECRHRRVLSLRDAWTSARAHAEPRGDIPIAVCREHGDSLDLAIVPWDYLLHLLALEWRDHEDSRD